MQGLHLTADLYRCRCDAQWLGDVARLQEACLAAVSQVGLPGGQPCFAAHAQGVSGCLLMDGSHVSLHTREALRAATVDVFLDTGSDDGARLARALMDRLIELLQPEWTEQRSLVRGDEA